MHTLIIFIVEAMYEAFLYQFMKTMHALVHHHFIVEEMYVKGVSVAFTDHKKILHACMHAYILQNSRKQFMCSYTIASLLRQYMRCFCIAKTCVHHCFIIQVMLLITISSNFIKTLHAYIIVLSLR